MYRFLICFLLLMPATINAGTLKGVVIDSLSDKPIIGVSIYVVGTPQGAITDIEGKFEIKNIKKSVFDVRVTCSGYHTKNIEDMKLHADSTKHLAIELETKPRELSYIYNDRVGRSVIKPSHLHINIPRSYNELPIFAKLYKNENDSVLFVYEIKIDEIKDDVLKHKIGFFIYDYTYMIKIFKDSLDLVLTLDNIKLELNSNAVINLDEILKSDKLKDKYIRLDSSLIHYESLK